MCVQMACAKKCACLDGSMDMCTSLSADMSADMCTRMRMDTCAGMHLGMRTDMCAVIATADPRNPATRCFAGQLR